MARLGYIVAAAIAWAALSLGVMAQAPTLPGFPPGAFQSRVATDAAPAPSGSGWGDHGTEIDLSTTTITNDTATSNSTLGFSTVRGTVAHGTTGKYYFEVKLLTAPPADALYIGLLDAATGTGAAMDTQVVNNGISTYCNDGTAHADGAIGLAGVNKGSACALAGNDILGIAYDATNGFHYLSQNCTFLTISGVVGDPTSGALGTGHVGAYTSTAATTDFYPRVSIWGLVNGVVQLKTAALTCSLPAGYSAWNFLLKRDLNPANDNTPMYLSEVA